MTPERMAALVARWVRFYTRNVPPPVAKRRIGEIDADLHDHIAHERAHGTGERRIAIGIAMRMARGVAADASWRRTVSGRRTSRVPLVTALVLLVPLIAMQFSDDVDWGVFDFVFAGVLIGGTGLLLERAMRKPANGVSRLVVVGIGVAAIVLGETDDAPGLVAFGGLLIVATVALAVRTAQRSE